MVRRAITVVVTLGMAVLFFYVIALLEWVVPLWDLQSRMSDERLSAQYAEHERALNEFARRFMSEQYVTTITIRDRRRFGMNNSAIVASDEDIGRLPLPVEEESLRFYLAVLRESGFKGAQVVKSPGEGCTYLNVYGGDSYEVDYGLIFSPEDLPPSRLCRAIYHYTRITMNWYTLRAK